LEKLDQRTPSVRIALLGMVLFVLASLWPWRHLVSGAYFLKYVGCSAALAVLSQALAGQFARRMASTPAGIVAAAGVFLSAWALNAVGPINVVLVHIDSLRADHCSSYGYPRETTPRMDAFAAEGAVRFERFFSQSAMTNQSTPAELAGILPSMFYDPQIDGSNLVVPDRFPLLSELLAARGYTCRAISSNPQIASRLNYARGFTTFDEVWAEGSRPHPLVERILAHVDRDAPGPFFTFALVVDPHVPYEPLPAFDRFAPRGAPSHVEIIERVNRGDSPRKWVQSAIDLYDGEIAEVDDAMGVLLDGLRERGMLDRTMVILTSDHGEKFLEYGELGHGGTLYEEVIHVPMFWSFPSPFRFPRLGPHTEVVGGVACHVDILPTVLGFLGERRLADDLPGTDLTAALYRREEDGDRRILLEVLAPDRSVRALRSRDRKLVSVEEGGTTSFVFVDPEGPGGERRDLALDPDHAVEMQDFQADLERRVALARSAYGPKPDPLPPSSADLEHLRALGYTE